MSAYGVIIDKTMLENAFKTDAREVRELLNLKLVLFVLFFGILPCLLVLKTRIVYAPKGIKNALLTRFASFFVGILLLLAIFVPQTQFFVPFFRYYYQSEYYTTPFYQLKSLVKYIKSRTFTKPPLEIIAPDARILEHKKRLLILVVGETARAANFSLLEKDRATTNETNPYTKKWGGVVFFNAVRSCGTSTAVSVPCMFSVSTRKQYKESEFKENALDILQKVGVRVVWFGNNSGGCQGVCERIKEVKMFNEDYDEALLKDIQNALNLGEQKIIIVHLQGSHGPTYYKRYPKDFTRFTPTCDTNELQKCTQEELTDTYDNTIAYSDYVISKLIKMLQSQSGVQASLLYVSDHGESLGENGIYLHAMPYFLAPKEQIHVPLLFYSNDKNLLDLAYKHKDYNLSHDYLFSTLLGYFDVHTKVYDKNLDIFYTNLLNKEEN